MPSVLNISAYRFVPIDDAPALRARLHAQAAQAGLRGTVLLAEEGINLFLAGAQAAVHSFLDHLRTDARFAGLQAKESWSPTQPFKKLLVKVKREIIRMDHPTIRPSQARAPAVTAATLARWLQQGCDDEGRPVALLDTRNGFEVDHGRFAGAHDWRLSKFSEFPAAFDAHRAELEKHCVVSYCTGGIRCEKAALYMQAQGFDAVWQLEGGILKYFEEVGGAHWLGNCFVFDEREALDSTLQPQ